MIVKEVTHCQSHLPENGHDAAGQGADDRTVRGVPIPCRSLHRERSHLTDGHGDRIAHGATGVGLHLHARDGHLVHGLLVQVEVVGEGGIIPVLTPSLTLLVID